MVDLRLIVFLVMAAIAVAVIVLIVRTVKKSKKPNNMTARPTEGPYIFAEYVASGSLLDDGVCGWLDIECENGETQTVELKFGKNAANYMFVPLKIAKYRISYRTKSKAAMVAEGVLTSINESNGAMGSFANAVYGAGVGVGQLSSIVVDVNESFVLKLRCSTNGFEKNCEVVG